MAKSLLIKISKNP